MNAKPMLTKQAAVDVVSADLGDGAVVESDLGRVSIAGADITKGKS
jgi:hypothetical protein